MLEQLPCIHVIEPTWPPSALTLASAAYPAASWPAAAAALRPGLRRPPPWSPPAAGRSSSGARACPASGA